MPETANCKRTQFRYAVEYTAVAQGLGRTGTGPKGWQLTSNSSTRNPSLTIQLLEAGSEAFQGLQGESVNSG
jgi:hypothetical protein